MIEIKNTGVGHWLGYEFESMSVNSPEFEEFAADWKRVFTKMLAGKFRVFVRVGHFYLSGVALNIKTDKLASFSIRDVRHFPNDWYKCILVRRAESVKDYTGGSNHYSEWNNIESVLERLTS